MGSPSAPLYQPYQAPNYTGGTVGYQSSNDPRKLAQNQRAVVQSTGDQFIGTDESLANQYAAQQAGTQAYLNPLEQANASGNGGYTSGEQSQIELSPQDKQNIVTGAGISSGVGTASAVGAAERAAAATGGNPAALMTYRARAAQTQGAEAGNAETQARVSAQQAGSAGAQAVGNAAISQENQGLNYLSGLQGQQGQQSQNSQGLAQGAYGTQTSGTGAATGQGITASQTPTTSDKIIGGLAGAASAFLADGDPGYLDDGGMDAVVGENGPEMIVEAASDPVRSHTKFMDDGGMAPDTNPGSGEGPEYLGDTGQNGTTIQGSGENQGFGAALKSYLTGAQHQTPAAPAGPAQPWNPTTPYSQLGTAIGKAAPMVAGLLADGKPSYRAKPMLANGWSQPRPHQMHPPRGGYQPLNNFPRPMLADGMRPMAPGAPKILSAPTRVHLAPGDQVVPLSYRPKAKVRPSVAMSAMAGARA